MRHLTKGLLHNFLPRNSPVAIIMAREMGQLCKTLMICYVTLYSKCLFEIILGINVVRLDS